VQNVSAGDTSEVSAARDVRYQGASGLSNEPNFSGMEVTGPGRLVVMAGRNVDLATAQGVISRGSTYNGFLPDQGADVSLLAGLGTDRTGSLRMPAYQAFADAYLKPGDAALTSFYGELHSAARRDVAFQIKRANPGMSDAESLSRADTPPYAEQVELAYQEARAAFDASPLDARARRVLFNELLLAGRAFADGTDSSYARGYGAIAALFPPGTPDAPIRYQGDINLFFSQVKTEQGGAIELLAPGGGVNAGLANPGSLAKQGSELGIVTVRGGDIRGFVDRDFLVNQSRVFTLAGGDIVLWSSNQDIDAGRGAKTTSATPPPVLRVKNGRIFFDITGSVSGAGIGVLLTREDVRPGDVALIAPRGEVNAGEAGIRAAGNLTIAAVRVVGADTIQVGGASSGVPSVSSAGLSGLGSTGGVGQEASRAADQTQKTMTEKTVPAQATRLPSFITVEVIGLGEEAAAPRGKDETRKDDER
jgi:hypothetical protein